MQRIWFANRSVTIAPLGTEKDYSGDTVYYTLQDGDDIAQLPFWFEKAEEIGALVVEAADPGKAFADFISGLKVEVAGGGLVRDKRGRSLLFWRRGAWDMPKGHQEPGETLEQCALREVKEETALEHLALGEPICTTYHTWRNKDRLILKESHWFRMTLTQDEPVKVQTEEDIVRARWCGPLLERLTLRRAWPSIREVFQA